MGRKNVITNGMNQVREFILHNIPLKLLNNIFYFVPRLLIRVVGMDCSVPGEVLAFYLVKGRFKAR